MPDPTFVFNLLLLLTTAGCGFMTGLVVFVDFVHYPAFHFVEPARGQAFHRFHTRSTGFVVGAPMLLEMAAGALLPFAAMLAGVDILLQAGAWLTFILLVGVWAETGLRVVPKHNILQNKGLFNKINISALVASNRIRTLIWSIRFLVLLFMLGFLLF